MARRNDWVHNSLFFVAGAMVCYALAQFRYLTIETSINVWETLLDVAALVVGIFIASSLQRKYNKNQNLYNYLVNRLDVMWSKFNAFHAAIEIDDKIEFGRVTSTLSDLQRANGEFLKLLEQMDGKARNDFEKLGDELQELFDACPQSQDIVYYGQNRSTILAKNSEIINNYIAIFAALNK